MNKQQMNKLIDLSEQILEDCDDEILESIEELWDSSESVIPWTHKCQLTYDKFFEELDNGILIHAYTTAWNTKEVIKMIKSGEIEKDAVTISRDKKEVTSLIKEEIEPNKEMN